MYEDNELPSVTRLAETTSTSSHLKELLRSRRLVEGSLVVADYQTQGRGQLGNHWESEAGKNLLFSLVVYPDFISCASQFVLSQIAALSVKEVLDRHVEGVSVKWPNDVYHNDRKICGMLIENEICGRNLQRSIIGIGINVNQEEFTGNAPNPVSLIQITGKEYDRDDLLFAFLTSFFNRYMLLLEDNIGKIQEDYRAALYRGTGYYPYTDSTGRFEARVSDVEESGHLVLSLKNGERRRYAFKEISFVLAD